MTTLEPAAYDDLRVQVESLLIRTKTALESDDRTSALAAALPILESSPVRIAVAGPHNAGKSMLIAAMLKLPQVDVDELTAATPKTSSITPYAWQGCELLDLPGTLSGLDEHDVEAAAGIRRADILLLVTTVELPGEAESRQIDNLLSEEGFAHRALVVVNKCNAEESDRDVVRAEMLARLASYPKIQVLFADAKDYVDSLNFPDLDQDERDLLSKDSGIDELAAELSTLATRHGRTARLQALCHEVRRASVEASNRWAADHMEESLEVTADRIRLGFADAQTALTDAPELALETLKAEIEGIGTSLAAAVSEADGSVDENRVEEAQAREVTARKQCEGTVNRLVLEAVSRLDEQLGTSIYDWDRYSVGGEAHQQRARGGPDDTKKDKTHEIVDSMLDAAGQALKRKFEEFVRAGVRPGSPAHDLARKINAVLGRTPKPYVHIRMAEKLTKVGKVAGKASAFLAPLADLKGVVDNFRRENMIKKRREEIRTTYSDHAHAVVIDESEAIRAHIEELLQLRRDAVAATLELADASALARTQARARLGALSEQAHELAAVIDQALMLPNEYLQRS
jgi:hypothetical protein